MAEFIYGKEKYLVRERMLELKRNFLRDYPTASVTVFDWAEDFDNSSFLEALNNNSLFAQEKLVIIKNNLKLNQNDQAKLLEILKEFKKKKNRQVTLVAVEIEEVVCKGKLFNFLKKFEQVKKFDLLKGAELNQRIADLVKQRSGAKVTIAPPAANWLGIITRANFWKISREVEKLISFKSEGEITLEDIKAICQGQVEGKIFDLVDAVGQGDKERALQLKSQLLNQGENEFYIFSMIMFQARNLLKVSECVRKGICDQITIAKKIELHPFVAKKTLGQLKKFSPKKISKIYKLAATIDLKSKQSDFQMAQELDYFLVKF